MLNINTVYNMDAMEGLKQLDDGSVDLVFADPPYNIGIQYGEHWDDSMPDEEYLEWCLEWIGLCYAKLKTTGSMYLMHYPTVAAMWFNSINYMKLKHWITWNYSSNIGHSKTNYTTAQRTILYYTVSNKYTFNALADPQPYKNPKDKRIQERMARGHVGTTPYNWWPFELVKNVSKEKTDWKNQIPLALVERIVKISSNPGDLVLDPFMGSGTAAVAANKNGRDYIGFDLDPKSIPTTKERIDNGY